MDSLIVQEVERVERGFPARETVRHAQVDTHAVAEALLQFPALAGVLRALRAADEQHIAHSRMLLPPHCRGVAVFAEWMHEAPATGLMSETAVSVHTELLRLFHLLREQGSAGPLYVEGPPRSSQFQGYVDRKIPGTSVALCSDEGQEALRRNPALLRTLIAETPREKTKVFTQFLSPRVIGDVRGIEREESHRRSGREMQTIAPDLGALTPQDLALIDGMLRSQTGFRRTVPCVCCFGGYEIALPELIARCERYVGAIRLHAQMQQRRDDELLDCVHEGSADGGIPTILCGQSHSVSLRERCAKEGIGLLLVTPRSLPPLTDAYFHLTADQRNTNYHIISFILPQLHRIRDHGRP